MNHQAGRELDALVAGRVMGFRKHLIHGYLHNAHSDEAFDASDPAALDYDDFYPGEEPHYSTRIADAWEVVEKLQALDRCVYMSALNEGESDLYGCRVHDSNGNDGEQLGWAIENSMPLAICLAALKAVGA